MPKKAAALGAAQIARLTKRGHYPVGGVPGLLLQVNANGSRSWTLRIVVGGRRRDIGLGGHPGVSLAAARARASELRDQVARGVDPIEERRAARQRLRETLQIPTFAEAASRFLSSKTAEFRNPKHVAQWRNTLEAYANPIFGKTRVDLITLQQVLQVLKQPSENGDLWVTKTETAARLRGRIEAVISWAIAHGYRSGENPARWRGNLDAVLPKPNKVRSVEHHCALPYLELPSLMRHLRVKAGIAARCLEFLILTATRSGEARGVTWAEIDLTATTWTIPASRMKAMKEHRVPLSPATIKLLKSLPRFEGSDMVFPAPRGVALSDTAVSKALRTTEPGSHSTVHGFRSTFRDWAGETTSFPREVIEHALAHQLKDKAEAAYARGTLFDKRRELMDAWAMFCSGASTETDAPDFKKAMSDG